MDAEGVAPNYCRPTKHVSHFSRQRSFVVKTPDGDVTVQTICDLRQLDSLITKWKSWPGTRDSDPHFFFAVVRSRGPNCLPHVIVLSRNGTPDAMLIGFQHRAHLSFRIGCFRLWEPEVCVIQFVPGSLRGNASEANCLALVQQA